MMDSSNVITAATKGIVEELAAEYEVGQRRMYEILSTDNPVPKAKKLIRRIAHCDKSKHKDRVRLIKADIDAMFAQILGDCEAGEVAPARLHSELSEAVSAKLEGKPKAERLKECREARAILDMEIECLERDEVYHQNFGGIDWSAGARN
jgi:hypothetical protein